jgi:ABC-2 type transport system ATP-binding protein
MIQAEDLSKQFEEFQAVDGVNLQIGAGEVLALLGPNGAGKTTTVRMLTSVLRPTRGWARVAGYDVVQDAAKVRGAVGVLTEQHGLYNRMPANSYLDFFGKIYHMNADARQKRIRSLLEGFGLDPDDKRPTGEYSKGMRQKLALARALIHDPPVLLLDEPTSAMDPESARLVRNGIHGLRSANRAIIICTHNLPEAEELADKIAIIRQGKIIIQGSASELKQRFLGPAEFEVRFSTDLNGSVPELPEQVRMTHRGDNWLRYQTEQPQHFNPIILSQLLANGFPVVSLQEVSRSLEQVYLQAINAPDTGEELSDGG